LLAEYALTKCDKVAALRKLSPNVKPRVIRILQSSPLKITPAALPVKKHATAAMGLDSSTQVFTNKVTYPDGKPPKWVKVKGDLSIILRKVCPGAGSGALPKVQGKGTVSAACNDCHGRGR
jgi:hypothetical protein